VTDETVESGFALDDGQLLERCRAGDETAWRALVERHARLVNGILRGGFRLSAADSEDGFQEVFTRLYLRLGTVRERDALPAWIAQVTRNVAVDLLRRSGREQPTEDVADDGAYDEPLRAVLDAMTVREAMVKLPDHQQEILELFFVKDESYRTIGEALGIPPGTVASRISRALAALRMELDGRSADVGTSTP
jgi:RNA polymerase sigma factor (sigma-70 family)